MSQVKKSTKLISISEYQKQFFMEWALKPLDIIYNISFINKIEGDLDLKKLKKACEAYVNQTEIVHAQFSSDGERCYYNDYTIDDFYIETSFLSKKPIEPQIKKYLYKPINLSEGPLLKIYLLKSDNIEKKVYYFFFVTHHVICDATWIAHFFNQISNKYNKTSKDEKISINTDTTFTRAVEAEKRFLSPDYKSKAQKFWLDLIGETPLKVDLPYQTNVDTINFRNLLADRGGEFIYFNLTKNQTSWIRSYAKEKETSVFIILSAIYSFALSKFINREKFFLSYPVNARTREFKEAPGCFVNNIPMRIDLKAVETLDELVDSLSLQRKEARSNQGYSLTDIIKDQRKSNDIDANNVFNIGFSQSYLNVVPFELKDLKTSPVDFTWSESSIHEIGLLYDERSSDNFKFKLEFRKLLFDQDLIRQFISAFKSIIVEFVQGKKISFKNYTVLPEKEYDKVVFKWNETDRDFPNNKTIHRLFQEQAAKTPDSTALVFEEEKLSYKELDEKSDRLAIHIREVYKARTGEQMQSGTLVPLCLERSLEMVVAIIAVLKAGGAYVPMDPSYPRQRIDYIIKDTKAEIVLSQRHLTRDGRLQMPEEKSILVDLGEGLYKKKSKVRLKKYASPTDLAYVIYTSGSTGNPKGVMVEHSGIVNRLEWMQNMYPLNSRDVVLQKTPYVFDVSVWELLWANWYGAKIILARPEGHKDSGYLRRLIQKNKVTTLHFVPSMLEAYNQYLQEQQLKLNPSLRQIFCSGEVLGDHVTNRTFQNANNLSLKLYNLYGPTEASIDVTYFETGPNKKVYIGRPIQNTKAYVLDTNGNPVPIGVSGELYIAGAGLARGYLNNRELTEQQFVPNPFATETDKQKGYDRLYRTGDLVRWIPDGNIEFIGRNDQQVKIRGYRIETGEVENALSKVPGIKQACVTARERQTGEGNTKYLAGYCVPDSENGALDQDTILDRLSETLPEYMVPSALVVLEAMPLTLNGKLDRRALPEPGFGSSDNYKAPVNELEAKLCNIWQKLLGIERIGVTDDFFRIGGDSILSIQVSSLIRQAGLDCQVNDIFDHRTIAKLSRHLSGNRSETIIKSEQGLLKGPFGMLPIQQWFIEQVDNGSIALPNHWNQSFFVKVPELDKNKLSASIETLVDHHDVLRIQYTKGKTWKQTYLLRIELPELKTLNVGQHSEEEIQKELTLWQSGFDLKQGPLFQMGYLHGYEDGSARIYFALHHMIVDGVSWRILAQDIKTLYEGNSLPSKGTSYSQWVNTVREYSERHPQEAAFWEEHLSKMPEYQMGEHLEGVPNTALLELNKTLTKSLLQKVPKAYNTEVNDLLLTALAYALKDINGNSLQGITLEGHGREDIDPSIDHGRTVGWFTTMFPVKLEVRDTLEESIRNIKEELRSIPNKGIGFGAFATKSGTGYAQGDLPPISFNYLGQFGNHNNNGQWQIANEASGTNINPSNKDRNLININGSMANGKLSFAVITKLGDPTTKQLARSLKKHLTTIIGYCLQKFEQQSSSYTPSDFKYVNLSQGLLDKIQVGGHADQNQPVHIYPANSLQQGFVYHALNQEDDDAYRVQVLFDYHRPLDTDLYIKAWEACIEQYPILRTAFDWEEQIVQIVYKKGRLQYKYHDISDLATEKERNQRINKIQEEDRKLGFDLTKPTLLRLHIIKQAENHYTLIKTEHHSIADGWSGPVLLNSLHRHYQSFLENKKVAIKEDTAYLEAQQYINTHKERITEYWDTALTQVEGTNDINALLNRPMTLESYRQVEQPETNLLDITGESYQRLKALSLNEGITINVILQFAWHRILQVYSGTSQTIVGTTVSGRDLPIEGIENSVGLYINTLPLVINWNNKNSVRDQLHQIQKQVTALNTNSFADLTKLQKNGQRLFHSIFVFENYPQPKDENKEETRITLKNYIEKFDYPLGVVAHEHDQTLTIKLKYDGAYLENERADQLLKTLRSIIEQVIKNPERPHTEISLLSTKEKDLILDQWNKTDKDFPRDKTIHQLFREQAAKTPNNIALVFQQEQLSYKELDQKSDRLALHIRELYKKRTCNEMPPDTLIPLCLERSLEMVVAMLAVLKAGGAYVPIDPAYPQERINYILSDTKAQIVLSQRGLIENGDIQLPKEKSVLVELGQELYTKKSKLSLKDHPSPTNLAYVIYTSGTTGNPKGVMVEHRSVINFFSGMDKTIPVKKNNHILAITSISFDISVLELIWNLVKGITITINRDQENVLYYQQSLNNRKPTFDFSIFYFSSQNESYKDKYKFIKESVKFADKKAFSAIWLPERHFHKFGGIFPNPSVLAAGLSTITNSIEIRSGSIVLPLHDVIRTAEEWSMVDNLSNGRVALSIASGWHSNDFVLQPENYHNRHAIMYNQIEDLKTLWSGGSIKRLNGLNEEVKIRVYPKPYSKELNIYITSSGNQNTFISAGKIGANVLTHLLGQDINELKKNISLYKQSLKENGFSTSKAKVVLMLHTYIGTDLAVVKDIVKTPFKSYLKSSLDLFQKLTKELNLTISDLGEKEMDDLLELAFERYWRTSALLGTAESCKDLLSSIYKIGVNEIACLVDFGIENEIILEGLKNLNVLKNAYSKKPLTPLQEIAPITTIQITPTHLGALIEDSQSMPFLKSLNHIIVGGEKLPPELKKKLTELTDAEVYNMYGPTETTIWSTFQKVRQNKELTIGKPIQNTKIYVLDLDGSPVPIGVIGELYIGGAGLARGYLNNPELTAERFAPNPFATESDRQKGYTRLYKTGDLVRWLPEGDLEFIGRNDQQIKIRGHRIELGEIEHALSRVEGIKQSCVIAKERETTVGTSKYLVGYYVPDGENGALNKNVILDSLSETLPEYFLPAILVSMEAMPLTVNGKLDRKALPDPNFKGNDEHVLPTTKLETELCNIWQEVLGLDNFGIKDDFFRIGGDSILSIQISSRIRQVGFICQVNDIFTYRTIEKLSQHLTSNRSEIIGKSEQGPLNGVVGLLPIQQWFIEQVENGSVTVPSYYNQSFLVKTPELDLHKLRNIIADLVAYHDAMRMRYTKGKTWEQIYQHDINIPELKTLDVSKVKQENIQKELTLWQSRFNLEKGPLFQIGYLYGYGDGNARIYFALHHMIVDGVSWRILAQDIKTLYEGNSLPSKGSSYRQWVDTVKNYPENNPEEVSYWENKLKNIPTFNVVYNLKPNPSSVLVELHNNLTKSLLQNVHKAYNTEINDLLLTALAYTLKDFNGNDVQGITLEGHGRENIDRTIDHSGTLGWFTSIFPVKLELKESLEDSIRSIKEELRNIPNKGIGFGAFAVRKNEPLTLKNLPLIIFNYLGQFDSRHGDWQIVHENSGTELFHYNEDPNIININGLISNEKLQFNVLTKFERQITKKLANGLNKHLTTIIKHCQDKLEKQGTSYTPSDFKSVKVSQSLLNELQSEIDSLEE